MSQEDFARQFAEHENLFDSAPVREEDEREKELFLMHAWSIAHGHRGENVRWWLEALQSIAEHLGHGGIPHWEWWQTLLESPDAWYEGNLPSITYANTNGVSAVPPVPLVPRSLLNL